jgi:hypothetical protein
VCCGVTAIVAQTRTWKARLTLAWAMSAMLSTNTTLGLRQRNGSRSTASCMATPNPGPLVRGSPSFWYFG